MTIPTPADLNSPTTNRPQRERQIISDLIEKVGNELLDQDNPSTEALGVFADLVQAHADLLAARTGAQSAYFASR
ncbi:hypothetical protein [Streptomyces diastatochromogenes]|uniref:hypothetical protein n=1 Tax=Streptomyces diastatochromogenes TaxID=42236 RepID=UPI00117ED26B|nr:hypothetical protein [Streptomyces diastatochromogenes]MCZ0986678.1 hypothetical protein [Streptomyces diastatochromogenes]